MLPAAAAHHRRQEKPGELGKGGDVEINLAEDFFFGHLGKFAVGSETGIVDEDVDGDAFALELVEEKFRRRRLNEIKRDGLRGDPIDL